MIQIQCKATVHSCQKNHLTLPKKNPSDYVCCNFKNYFVCINFPQRLTTCKRGMWKDCECNPCDLIVTAKQTSAKLVIYTDKARIRHTWIEANCSSLNFVNRSFLVKYIPDYSNKVWKIKLEEKLLPWLWQWNTRYWSLQSLFAMYSRI